MYLFFSHVCRLETDHPLRAERWIEPPSSLDLLGSHCRSGIELISASNLYCDTNDSPILGLTLPCCCPDITELCCLQPQRETRFEDLPYTSRTSTLLELVSDAVCIRQALCIPKLVHHTGGLPAMKYTLQTPYSTAMCAVPFAQLPFATKLQLRASCAENVEQVSGAV